MSTDNATTPAPFIITGMPRARTAWLANYLTSGSVLCEHEALSRFTTPDECATWLLERTATGRPTGMSDSGAVYFADALAAALPGAKWVVIRRTVYDCEASFQQEHGIGVDLWAHKRKMDDAIMRQRPLVVDFKDIDVRAREIAEHCVPGWVHDEDRHRMLLRFDVRLTDPALKSGIKTVQGSGLLAMAEPPRFTPAMIRADAIMREALAINPSAQLWWRELCELVDIYDHTVDRDGLDVEKTHRAFKSVMLSWPVNPFLSKFATVLVPVMSAAISAWQYGGRSKAADIYTETANAMIFVLHGQQGVEKWMPELRACHAQILADDQRKDG